MMQNEKKIYALTGRFIALCSSDFFYLHNKIALNRFRVRVRPIVNIVNVFIKSANTPHSTAYSIECYSFSLYSRNLYKILIFLEFSPFIGNIFFAIRHYVRNAIELNRIQPYGLVQSYFFLNVHLKTLNEMLHQIRAMRIIL